MLLVLLELMEPQEVPEPLVQQDLLELTVLTAPQVQLDLLEPMESME